MKHFSFIMTFYTGRYEFSNEGTAILMCAALMQWTVKTKTHPSIVYFMSRFRGMLSSGAHPFNCSCSQPSFGASRCCDACMDIS